MDAIWRNVWPQTSVVGKPNNLFTPTAKQEYQLGARYRYGGWTFHYSYAGGVALVAGYLVYSTGTPVESNKTVGTAAAIGETYIPNITTAAAQLYLEGGKLVVNDVAGEGHTYLIEKSAANASTATSTDVWLYDPLRVALTTSSQVELFTSKYYDLDVVSGVNNLVAGVPIVNVPINYYFWLLTWGEVSVLNGGTTVAGEAIIPHTDGSVLPCTVVTEQVVGKGVAGGTATEFNTVEIRIAP